MCFSSMYSYKAHRDRSLPKPLSFHPPKGAPGTMGLVVLTPTDPASSLSAKNSPLTISQVET